MKWNIKCSILDRLSENEFNFQFYFQQIVGFWAQEYDVQIRWPAFPVFGEKRSESIIVERDMQASYSCVRNLIIYRSFSVVTYNSTAEKSLESSAKIIVLKWRKIRVKAFCWNFEVFKNPTETSKTTFKKTVLSRTASMHIHIIDWK